mmetsp:Transcript_30074/g.69021  ORF Transcript_30074/g.69021 Transcript_30074/m.69021 type:complete len:284 (+) Transcript_30074:192-1043(+)
MSSRSSSRSRCVGGLSTSAARRRRSSASGLSSLAKPAERSERASLWCLSSAGLSRYCSLSASRTIGASCSVAEAFSPCRPLWPRGVATTWREGGSWHRRSWKITGYSNSGSCTEMKCRSSRRSTSCCFSSRKAYVGRLSQSSSGSGCASTRSCLEETASSHAISSSSSAAGSPSAASPPLSRSRSFTTPVRSCCDSSNSARRAVPTTLDARGPSEPHTASVRNASGEREAYFPRKETHSFHRSLEPGALHVRPSPYCRPYVWSWQLTYMSHAAIPVFSERKSV